MRISDWSSDVYSSDLPLPSPGRYPEATAFGGQGRRYSSESRCSRSGSGRRSAAQERAPKGSFSDILPKTGRFWSGRPVRSHMGDRKSVVSGKSVSVGVDLGGRRIIRKKKNELRSK